MSVSRVQGPTGTSNGSTAVTTCVVTYGTNPTAGNLLVAAINWGAASGSVSSVKDSQNQTWTLAGTLKQANGVTVGIYYFNGTVGGANTVTLTMSPAQSFAEIYVWEYHTTVGWPSGSGIVDQSNSGTSATGSASPGSVTTTVANEALVSTCAVGSSTSAGATGWTFTETGNGNGVQDDVVSATGTYTGSFTSTGAWSAVVSTFKEQSGFTVGMQVKSQNTFKVAAAVRATFQVRAGITLAKVVAAVNTAMQARAGMTNVKVAAVISVTMASKSQNSFKVVAAVTNGMVVHAIVTASATGGNQPAAPQNFVFCDWLGVHRVGPD